MLNGRWSRDDKLAKSRGSFHLLFVVVCNSVSRRKRCFPSRHVNHGADSRAFFSVARRGRRPNQAQLGGVCTLAVAPYDHRLLLLVLMLVLVVLLNNVSRHGCLHVHHRRLERWVASHSCCVCVLVRLVAPMWQIGE